MPSVTPNYHLDLYEDDEILNTSDANSNLLTIDRTMKANETTASNAVTVATEAKDNSSNALAQVGNIVADMQGFNDNVAELNNTTTELSVNVNALNTNVSTITQDVKNNTDSITGTQQSLVDMIEETTNLANTVNNNDQYAREQIRANQQNIAAAATKAEQALETAEASEVDIAAAQADILSMSGAAIELEDVTDTVTFNFNTYGYLQMSGLNTGIYIARSVFSGLDSSKVGIITGLLHTANNSNFVTGTMVAETTTGTCNLIGINTANTSFINFRIYDMAGSSAYYDADRLFPNGKYKVYRVIQKKISSNN